jgi:hypothetical protein
MFMPGPPFTDRVIAVVQSIKKLRHEAINELVNVYNNLLLIFG